MRYVYLLAFFTALWACLISAAGAPLNGRRRMHQFGEQFREFDQDRNGVVDAQEIRSALGIMPTRFVDMFLKRVDVDQDGKSWLMYQVSCRMERAEIQEFQRQHYSSMDLNQDGLIDAQELRTTILGLPVEYHPVAEKSLLDMVHKMDTNQDGISRG